MANYLAGINLSEWLRPEPWCAFGFGAIIGSFLNVCIYRIPEHSFLKNHRSICACGKVIPWYNNVPILSYLWLRGRAECCGRKISLQYLFVECATAAIFTALYQMFPFFDFRDGVLLWHQDSALRFFHDAIFLSVLMVCSFIDLKHMIIPDRISIPMLILSPVAAAIHPDLKLQESLVGMACGAGILYLIAWLYWFGRKRVGLGFGDVKLLGFIGGWLGVVAVPFTLLVGSTVGSVVGITMVVARRTTTQSPLPFGPFLALGAFAYIFFGDVLHRLIGF